MGDEGDASPFQPEGDSIGNVAPLFHFKNYRHIMRDGLLCPLLKTVYIGIIVKLIFQFRNKIPTTQ